MGGFWTWLAITLVAGGFFDRPAPPLVWRMAGACPVCGRIRGSGSSRCSRCGTVA